MELLCIVPTNVTNIRRKQLSRKLSIVVNFHGKGETVKSTPILFSAKVLSQSTIHVRQMEIQLIYVVSYMKSRIAMSNFHGVMKSFKTAL